MPSHFNFSNFCRQVSIPQHTGIKSFAGVRRLGTQVRVRAQAQDHGVAATVRVARTLARPPPAVTSASGIICNSPAVAVAAPGTKEEGAKAGDQAADVRRHHYVRHVRHVRHRSTIHCKVSFKYFLSFWSSFSVSSGNNLKKNWI